ncbi:ribonuclease HII [Vagococcus vulneris]|uniref:Ribonuclease HII n=1 Tax=Vagococcus vulneris TaxID=1977869 RepID=A0A430A1W5_9ENTE|nr:ribonuclease HII [Vagococcus vulneris]RSU00446.1 ribonuclease HII [Vagococcus vulneris]
MTKETIKSIKNKLQSITQLDDDLLVFFQKDERRGVQAAVTQRMKQIEKQEKLKSHFYDMMIFENQAAADGFKYIAGIDEVGRGPLAGPVVASAVILPRNFKLFDVNDSKKLSEKTRDRLFEEIMRSAISVGVGVVSETIIDDVNIYEATKIAMLEAVNNLEISPDKLLIDAMNLDYPVSQEKIIKGDARSVSIACASIIAKVTRDRMMIDYDRQFPGYGFAKNMGYGTKEHLLGLDRQGYCMIHRKSFAPIKDMV